MPLQNRVTPFGDIVADPARGLFMGNRGGRFHRDDRSLKDRHFASTHWLICILSFKERRRSVMGRGYTELFFCDEATALAAGHRPCFECQRQRAMEFRSLFPGQPSSVDAMDDRLHGERLDPSPRPVVESVPDGAFVAVGATAFAVRQGRLLQWSSQGYRASEQPIASAERVLTPPATLMVLRAGYRPIWHPSAALNG